MDVKIEINGLDFFGDGKKEPTNWKRGDYLGGGSFGKVYEGTVITASDENVTPLAVKEIQICSMAERDTHEGSLNEFINRNGMINENWTRLLSKQILESVAYLHGVNIIHRDIKSENVLMLDENNIKLADFSLARVFGEITHTYTKGIGTVRFMAPEMIKDEIKYNRKVDVWSVGCVVLHMLTGKCPFYGLEAQQVLYHLCKTDPSPAREFLTQISESARKFLEKTFQVDLNKRPSAESLLTDIFIIGLGNSIKPLNFMLIGNFGNGKSLSGNFILHANVFVAPTGTSVQKGSTIFEDHLIKVVSFPDIDVDVTRNESLETFQNIMTIGFKYCSDGYSALILVMEYGRWFTNQDDLMLNFMRTTLGSDVVKNNVICLFIYRDIFKSNIDELSRDFQSRCQQKEGHIKDLLKECDYRCFLFNEKSREESLRNNQIKTLMSLAKLTKPYTKDDYNAARQGREKQKLENLSVEKFLKEIRAKMFNSETESRKLLELLILEEEGETVFSHISELDKYKRFSLPPRRSRKPHREKPTKRLVQNH